MYPICYVVLGCMLYKILSKTMVCAAQKICKAQLLHQWTLCLTPKFIFFFLVTRDFVHKLLTPRVKIVLPTCFFFDNVKMEQNFDQTMEHERAKYMHIKLFKLCTFRGLIFALLFEIQVPTMYTRLIQGYEAMDPQLQDASASAASQLRLMVSSL